MRKLKVCSLFSGIGGFETGLFEAYGRENVEIVFASEIDKFASKSYSILYNHEPYGDITKIHEWNVPEHDFLVAGFPCQAFSFAGKRQGFEDTRGTLFFDIARIIKWRNPKVILLENVKGLLNHDNGNTLETIVKVLSDTGYAVDFSILNSKYFGVPQSRERLYIVAAKDVEVSDWDLSSSVDNSICRVKKSLINNIENLKTHNFNFPIKQEVKVTLSDILEENVDERFFLNDEIAEALTDQIKEINLEDFVNNDIKKLFDLPKEIHNDQERQRRVYGINGISPTLLARQDTSKIVVTEIKNNKLKFRIRKLTPSECFRLQGFPKEYYRKLVDAGLSTTQLYKQAGNAVTTNVIKELALNIKPLLKNKKVEV